MTVREDKTSVLAVRPGKVLAGLWSAVATQTGTWLYAAPPIEIKVTPGKGGE
ncbi:hypothetical protein LOK74_19930 [Brevibacillus humidisoli]|uniref:hypothetical protein n=1 Tax=Brevibacillus humidisoli TaxID=2895522 RepID=UPI001E33F25A|nr:hypothetical protein [Brevibacillus humidisoli]UFJ40278.1 hypothetical protein LOK74_19930 [Brevibacillus humidisoli]